MTTTRDTGDLVARAARLLGEYIKSGRTRTDVLKQAAEAIADLREAHTLEDGRPDWGGRSPQYRAAIHGVYTKARVPEDKLDTVQQAIRYHLGNLIRDRVDADSLAEAGFGPVTPRERLSRNREVVAALAASGTVAEITRDPIRLIAHAHALLDYVTEEDLVGLRSKDKAVARRALVRLCDRADALRDSIVTRGGAAAATG